MQTHHTLDDLRHYNSEAKKFFSAQLMLLKEALPKISDERVGKASTLLTSAGQTGAAIFQLSMEIDTYSSEIVMLARSFIEKLTNFCYVCVCNDEELRAFALHPVYKYYHGMSMPRLGDDLNKIEENATKRKEKQQKFKEHKIVQEALSIFSDTKSHLNWTKKTLSQRIDVIEETGKLLDVFFTIGKLQYYSDASEALHGSLYGCTFDTGVFDPEFDHAKGDELEKKLYKDNTCVLLHLGMLIHECFTLISYSTAIKEIWEHSYSNRGAALNLLLHVIEKKKEKEI